jgi:serine/threonine-protein kinase RsbT
MMVEKKSWEPSSKLKECLRSEFITPTELQKAITECYSYLIGDQIMADSVFKHQYKEVGASQESPTKSDLIKVTFQLDKVVRSFRSQQCIQKSKMHLNSFINQCKVQIPTHSIDIIHEHDIAKSREAALRVAKEMGFSSVNCNKIVTTVSELTRNIIQYTPGGAIKIGPLDNSDNGIEIIAEDKGSGIPNLNIIMAGKYISKSGLGKGIVGCNRLMDVFDINTSQNGTMIRAVKYSAVR